MLEIMSDNSVLTNVEMRVDPQRAKQLVENLNHVIQQISTVNKSGRNIRIIAVSKLKPANDILALHQGPCSQVHFGENYLQELQTKAELLPKTIKWHFIGALQTNKCKPLAETISNLWCVSSVDTVKKADALEKGRSALMATARGNGEVIGSTESLPCLKVLVQVNTSGETEKSGVEPDGAAALCRHIRENCPHLKLSGLMTIGAIARSQATTAETENEDFVKLRDVRSQVALELGIEDLSLDLSMGMSEDFEGAIAQGSNEVRIGSTIFGERPPKNLAKIVDGVEDSKN